VIVSRVRMHPFGFFSDRTVDFLPGLNVVLGPNEAGKSTLFHAVRHVLFVPAKLRKPEFDSKIVPLLPASGGDSIRVDLEIRRGAERWVLKRRWGAVPESELVLPGGGSLGDEAAIKAQLADLLPARPAAVAHILMTRQSSLAETLELLRKDGRESLSDLADILRRAVLETGGVSVDRFVERLTEDRARAFARWDVAARGPEKSRGSEKRWRDGGKVHAAWWAMEDIRAAWMKTLAYEAALDELNAELSAAAAACEKGETFLKMHAAAARDARERRALDGERRAARGEADALMKISREWPVAEHTAATLQEAMVEAGAARAALEAELQSAQKAEDARSLLEKRARVLRRKTVVDEAAARLAALPRLEKKSLDELRAASAEVARLEAGHITVTVAGRTDVEIAVQEDYGPEEQKKLARGQAIRLQATGRLRLVHRDIEIEVRSGDAETESRTGKAQAARTTLAALLSRHSVPDLETAESRHRAWADCASDLRAAEKSLSEELAGETVESLDQRAAAIGTGVQTRPLPQIATELATSRALTASQTRELAELRRRLAEWAAEHGTLERLIGSLAVLKGRESDLDQRLARSTPVPEGFTDADDFLAVFEKTQEDLGEAKAALAGLKGQKREMEREAEAPGYQSAEELAVQLQDARDSFDGDLRRAEALDRLLTRSAALMRTSDNAVFTGMKVQLSAMIRAMTTGRHAEIEMEGAVPVALAGESGKSVAWEQLSAGTKDTLALALRLSMASYFLGDADGFMLLDDPLVDMDPGRQKAAAETLKAFAATRQLIVFTCHPRVAELLGGNLVSLGESA
jgi:exonuclease SbcC